MLDGYFQRRLIRFIGRNGVKWWHQYFQVPYVAAGSCSFFLSRFNKMNTHRTGRPLVYKTGSRLYTDRWLG